MKILVDLIHPANYHYFKYFIKEIEAKGNHVVISARNKDVLHKLLELDGRRFISTGKGSIGRGAIGKLIYLLYAEIKIFTILLKSKPDIVLSFGSTPCAHNSFIFRIPHISFDDTEHAKLNRRLYAPFTDIIFTPTSFYEEIGKNQIRFNSLMELFYLHPYRFKARSEILEKLKIDTTKKLVLLRFVSWEAFHDIGQGGLSRKDKIDLVSYLSKSANVCISSEGSLPKEIEKYKIKLPENEMHDLLSYLDLYIGEGGTMASECAVLGIPAIYINSLPLMGYLQNAEKSGLLFHLKYLSEIKSKITEILNDASAQSKFSSIGKKFIEDKIDPTSLLVWFVDNYPQSKKTMLQNPEYQNNFK